MSMPLSHPLDADGISAEAVVLANRPIRSGATVLSRFGDDRWDLSPAMTDVHSAQQHICWDRYPTPFVDAARTYVYALINVVNDPPRLPFARSAVPAVKTIWSDMPFLRHFLRWLIVRGRLRLDEVTRADLSDHLLTVQDLESKTTAWKRRALIAVQRLHLYREHLPAQHRLPAGQLWGGAGAAELANDPGPRLGENKTLRIQPEVMEPLLSAALFTTTVVAADLLPVATRLLAMRSVAHAVEPATRQAKARQVAVYRGSTDQLKAFLPALAAAGLPLPTTTTSTGEQVDVVGLGVAGRIGQTNLQVPQTLQQISSYGLPTRRDYLQVTHFTPVDGHRWRTVAVDAFELRRLLRHVVAAAFLVIAYLSGVRTGEALNLRRGCISHDPDLDLVFMSGMQMKTGDAGRTRSRATLPWVVTDEVRQAVDVLEALTTGDLLFPTGRVFSPEWMTTTSQRARTPGSISQDLSEFITWFNDDIAPGIGHPAIPADQHGPVTAPRLRRTLAWHIVRRPGGLVAGATQYGHVRTQIMQGYSGRADAGFTAEVRFEELLARVDHLHADAQQLQAGEHVSGPSATDYLDRMNQAAQFEGFTLTSKAQERQLLTNPALNIHHGDLFTCVFTPETAACVTRDAAAPNLSRCQVGCSNITITDRDVDKINAEVANIQHTLAGISLPQPLRQRLTDRRDALQAKLDAHTDIGRPS